MGSLLTGGRLQVKHSPQVEGSFQVEVILENCLLLEALSQVKDSSWLEGDLETESDEQRVVNPLVVVGLVAGVQLQPNYI